MTELARPAIERIPALDGLRGIAVIAVITIHTFMVVGSDLASAVDRTANLLVRTAGPLGVDLFFVLSGFLITSILDATRASTHPFRTFYVRRVLRIVPLYYAYLLIIPLIFASWGKIAVGTTATRSWDWLFLTNVAMTRHSPDQLGFLFGHFWSLAIEEHFYVLWPLAILLIPRSRLPVFCVALFAFSAVGRVLLTVSGVGHYGWLLMPFRMDGLAAGAFVSVMRAQHPEALDRAIRISWRPAMFLGLPALTALLMRAFWRLSVPLYSSFETGLTGRKLEIMLTPLIGAMVFGLVVARLTTRDGNPAPRLLTSRLLTRVGKYSYGMYLFHAPLVVLFFLIPGHHKLSGLDLPFQLVAALAVLGVSLLVGATTWHLLEKRCLSLAPDYEYPAGYLKRVSADHLV